LPLIPTMPVIVVSPKACLVGTASNAKAVNTIPTDPRRRETDSGLRSVKGVK
jgi:hypothetical protein